MTASPDVVTSHPTDPDVDAGPADRRRWRLVALAIAVLLVVVVGAWVGLRPDGGNAAGSLARGPDRPPVTPTAAPTPVQFAPYDGAAPSGVEMPTGDIPGWRQTFTEDFDRGGLDDRWYLYEGQPGGDPGGWFLPSHVTQSDGRLLITGSKEATPNGELYATGGISNSKTFAQRYGRFEFRFRMDEGYGINFAMLLWPADDSWPPEINVAEDNGLSRDLLTATLHYGAKNSTIARKSKGVYDLTQWHTAAVEWKPGSLTYLLDGKAWTSAVTSPNVPKIDMTMAIQAQAWPCGTSFSDCPNASTPPAVKLEVDWAVAYAAA